MTENLGMRDRVRLEAEPDHIGVWPDQPNGQAGQVGEAGQADQNDQPESEDGAA